MNIDDGDSCQLLGPVSLLIQSSMGLLAIGGVLIKRRYERPRRRWKVWCFDVGKQVLGSLILHFLNVGISILKQQGDTLLAAMSLRSYNGEDDSGGDQCDWYFLNLLMDTTVGTLVLWLTLSLLENWLTKLGVQNIESGNYYSEPLTVAHLEEISTENAGDAHAKYKSYEPLFSAFGKQLMVFVCGLAVTKMCIFLVLAYFEVLAVWFAKLALGWSNPWPNFQVFLVMFVFPVFLNCFQYFCVDSIIKLHPKTMSSSERENFEDIYSSTASSAGSKNTYGAIP
ncbi:LAME_0F12134g1_1 [Lachancea meyersii CBS 8951]|uniref:LAME_0F12134g1_1 n=1 Tax=Lachancea meyersii CBS 8951 TaxID=1266667 RepID=A0A1G4JWM2_9SACH|nr:LAME_0F12134g1_1 [Lachancea meyersii CBS 8951]